MVKILADQFEEFAIIHVLRKENDRPNVLSKLIITKKFGQNKTLI